MKKLAIAFPIEPSAVDGVRAFGKEAVENRRAEFTESRARLGVVREQVWAQHNPDGSVTMTLYLVALDPVEANRRFAASAEAFDRWFKDSAGALFGVDFDQPLPPISRCVYESIPTDL